MAPPYAEQRILAPRAVLAGPGNPNSLENLIVDQLPNGAVCYVLDQDDFFVLDKFSMATVSSPNVIATARGSGQPGRWLRYTYATYAANWAVTDWYLDGTVGNDANNGTTAGTPLRTGAELARRLGPYALWGQSVTVHVLADLGDSLILYGAMLVEGTHLDIIGTPTVLASDTIGTYVALNHATPSATQITGTAIVDWSPYQWRRIRVTSGVRAGTVAWIAAANPAGVGVATARITRPLAIDVAATATNVASQTLVPGDPIVVDLLPFVPSLTLVIDGPILLTNGPAYDRRQYSIQNIDCPILQLVCTANVEWFKTLIFGNRLDVNDIAQPPRISGAPTLEACLLAPRDFVLAGNMRITGAFNSCLFGDGAVSIVIGNTSILTTCLLQGAFLTSSNAFVNATDMQIFDVPNALATACTILRGVITNISGSGNAGYGIGLQNCSLVRYPGATNNLLGALSNGRLPTAPAINLSLPQLLQTSDYAQQGITGAMTAGAITVTVPWYENTTQRVTATHAVFAGTPGILSVQQISTTQFTITSSSALDTSTVNWQISPLGRNIFVSTN